MSTPDIDRTSTQSTTSSSIPRVSRSHEVVASYPDYAAAQRAVDHLSDRDFPVDRLRIIGEGLRTVERVTGRLTTWRAALGGAASGALIGGLFGAAGHAALRGRRDFSSVQGMVAERYDVVADPDVAGRARVLLAELPAEARRERAA